MTEVLAEERQPTRFEKLKRYLPAIFFIGGFAWDAFFLGTRMTTLDLVLLVVYISAAALILHLLGREKPIRFAKWLVPILQFFLGGVFNALVIFYFISSANLGAFLVVALLTVLLVGNEFLHRKYDRLTLSWTMFAIALTMLLNFVLPTLFRSISVFWFYTSSLLALFAVVLLRRAAHQERASVLPSFGAVALLIILFALKLIPPVPLAQKKMLIAHSVTRTAKGYSAEVDRKLLPQLFTQTIHRASGERLYCFTSIYVPPGIETRITHRWDHYDESRGEWINTSNVTFPVRSGRKEGYRGYSFKRNVTSGLWRVEAESESGQTIGVVKFRVKDGAAKTKKVRF